MAPGLKNVVLLYVSNWGINTVSIYLYPRGELVGTLTGLTSPNGICNDKKGDVWIVNNVANGDIVEYAHGGTQVKATVSDPGVYPLGCSVDPTTGNLAVTNVETTRDFRGTVSVYTNARGLPRHYWDLDMYYVFFCGYDDKGNLYVDGLRTYGGAFVFAELAKGSNVLKTIALTGGTIHFPGNVRWDGKYVAVGDQEYEGQVTSAIYQTTGSGGAIVGTTPLTGTQNVIGFAIDGETVVVDDTNHDAVEYFRYRAGGQPTKTMSNILGPYGTAISK